MNMLTHTHRKSLFNGPEASSVMISPENGPPRAKGNQTAAGLQVGQWGTTELGRNSCPPTPWEVQSVLRMDGSGVFNKQQGPSTFWRWNLLHIACFLPLNHFPLVYLHTPLLKDCCSTFLEACLKRNRRRWLGWKSVSCFRWTKLLVCKVDSVHT